MTAPAFAGTFTMVDPEHVAQIGPAAAILFARICWRADANGGSWAATRRLLQQETGLTESMVRTAVKALRDRGWLTATRASTDDATLVWAPVFAGQPDMEERPTSDVDESATPPCEIVHMPPVKSSISFLETEELPLVVPIEPTPKRRRAKAPAVPYPADFRPTPAHLALAAKEGVDLTVEGPKFVDYHTAKGSTFANWNAALNLWIRNAAKFARERQPEPTRDSSPASWAQPYTPEAAAALPPQRPRDWVAGW